MPPVALDLDIAASELNLSSELSSKQYSPLKKDMQYGASDEKICGSLRKTRSGLVRSMKFLRLNKFLLIPSIFQEREMSGRGWAVEVVGEGFPVNGDLEEDSDGVVDTFGDMLVC